MFDVSICFPAALADPGFLFDDLDDRWVLDWQDERTFVLGVTDGEFSSVGAITPIDPGETLDTRFVGEDFDVGPTAARLKLGVLDQGKIREIVRDDYPDPWGEHGRLRDTARLIAQWLQRGAHAVVLHGAGRVVLPAEQMLYLLGDVEDLDQRPWAAFLDFMAVQDEGFSWCRSYGMPAFYGLPDVVARVPGSGDQQWFIERTMQAVQHAARELVAGRAQFESGAILEVPHDSRTGRTDAPADGYGDIETWIWGEANDEGVIGLKYRGRQGVKVRELLHPADAWVVSAAEKNPDRLSFSTYATYVRELITQSLGMPFIQEFRYEDRHDGDLPPFSVALFENENHDEFVFTTLGLAREIPPHASQESGNERIELMGRCDEFHPFLANLLAVAAEIPFQTEVEGGLADGDVVQLPGALAAIVFTATEMDLGRGPAVTQMLLVPLLEDDLAELQEASRKEWIAAKFASDDGPQNVRRQWRRALDLLLEAE